MAGEAFALDDPERREKGPQLDALIRGRHGDPFSLLGPHVIGEDLLIRVWRPDVDQVVVLDNDTGVALGRLVRIDRRGLYCGLFAGAGSDPRPYRLRISKDTHSWEEHDPYRFGPQIGEVDIYLIAEGTHRRLYDVLGAHRTTVDGIPGTRFAVWAPNALRVSVVGDFNGWNPTRHPMRRRVECGVWELFVPGVEPGALYKYELIDGDGHTLPQKADPMGQAFEQPPRTAAMVPHRQAPFVEREGKAAIDWIAERSRRFHRRAPVSIYEVHLGSWMRMADDGNRVMTYDELGDRLIPYAVELGFTHLELLPITEHPFDGSWGYQPLGLFAPTSRYGTTEDFARFMNRCHEAGLGVILDWVPGHFPNDPHGLAQFDGTHLYEHADPNQGFHQDWNTLIYNYGRREVANFLLASAQYWLGHYGIDGLRVDAVASMLYLDYSREPGQWTPNVHGGNENLEAIDFLKRLNTMLYQDHEGIMTIAEESTSWPGVSMPVDTGGLGFGYKWNMGWMHDTLAYMSREPIHRSHHHHSMTFGLLYAFSENFILPLSHDEVVHGKGSILGRMPGDRWQRFANLRVYYTFMFAHPGKKLLFMGDEFGQEREWSHEQSLDWHLMSDRYHGGVRRLVTDLNAVYRERGALHERDCEVEGFEWLIANDAINSVYAFLRYGEDRSDPVLCVFNFTPVPRHFYRVGVPFDGPWREILNSDSVFFGGSNIGNHGQVHADAVEAHGHSHSLALNLPPLGGLMLSRGPAS